MTQNKTSASNFLIYLPLFHESKGEIAHVLDLHSSVVFIIVMSQNLSLKDFIYVVSTRKISWLLIRMPFGFYTKYYYVLLIPHSVL